MLQALENRINTGPRCRFINKEMMLQFLGVFALFCEGALQKETTCNDPEINDECLTVCRLDYVTCRQNCDSTSCESACLVDYADCNSSCPCGADCPAGCVDCPEHPFCEQETTTTTQISTTTTEITPIEPSDVFILVIPYSVDESYLQSGDGSSQISATINAPKNEYPYYAAHALVNGKLHIFGGDSDSKKIARLDDCTLNELTVRLNEQRSSGHAALSIENGKKALICFGNTGYIRKTCEIFDGSTTVSTFASNWTHQYGALGLYENQPSSVGCYYEEHQKAETLSASGWNSLPDHPKRISEHSLVGLENQSMLLIGGIDWGNRGALQSGIWQLKDENWNKIGELLQADYRGSAIYIGRSIYNFGFYSAAIERLDINEKEELQSVSKIGNQPDYFFYPVLFQTVSNYCI